MTDKSDIRKEGGHKWDGVDPGGVRFWCDSVDKTFSPRREIPRGEKPGLLPEQFLAEALRFLRACCDTIEDHRGDIAAMH